MTRVRLSIRFMVAVLLAVALYVGARLLGGFFIWYLFDFLAALFVFECVLGVMLFQGATVSRHIRRAGPDGVVRLAEDDTVAVEVTVRPSVWLPLSWCRVTDVLPEDWSYREMASRVLLPTFIRTHRISYCVPHVKRGVYALSTIRLTAGDWFGLFQRRKQFTVTNKIIVHPDPLPVSGWQTLMGLAGGASHPASDNMDDPNQPFAVRPHVPGDAMHRIHWRATAHHGKMMTRVGESYSARGLCFLLDHTGIDTLADLRLEWRIRVLASLLAEAHRQGQTWQLQLHPVHIRRVAPGHQEPWRQAMDALSAVRGSTSGGILREIQRLTLTGAQNGMIVLVTRDPDAPLLEAVSNLARRTPVLWCIAEPARPESSVRDVQDVVPPTRTISVTGARVKWITRVEDLTFDGERFAFAGR